MTRWWWTGMSVFSLLGVYALLPQETFNPLGFGGSPLARLASERVFETAEEAHHGGNEEGPNAPRRTKISQAVQEIDKLKGGEGRISRGMEEVYRGAVERWVTLAFKIDPGNWSAFLPYYTLLTEEHLEVEFPDEEHEHSGHEEVLGGKGDSNREEAGKAASEYLTFARPRKAADFYRMAMATFFLYQCDPEKFGKGRGEQLSRLKRIVGEFTRMGDKAETQGENWGDLDRRQESKRFAKGLLFNIEKTIEREDKRGDKPLNKRGAGKEK